MQTANVAQTPWPGGGGPAQSLAWQTWGPHVPGLSWLLLFPAAAAAEAGCPRGHLWARAWTQEQEGHSDLQELGRGFCFQHCGRSCPSAFQVRTRTLGSAVRGWGCFSVEREHTLSAEPGLRAKGKEGVVNINYRMCNINYRMCKGPEAGRTAGM